MKKQIRVNERTKRYDGEVPEALRSTDEARDEASALARKQEQVEEMMRRMAIQMNKEQPAGR